MNICVVVPSVEHKKSASVRIRYVRIQPEIQALGHSLDIKPIHKVDPDDRDYDVVLFSKCHDVRALVLARKRALVGTLVGVDVVDDFLIHDRFARLSGVHYWYRNVIELLDFAVCGTTELETRFRQIAPLVPVHIMNDPGILFDLATLTQAIKCRLRRARESHRLTIGWFGYGDSPYFPLGLHDLVAFSDVLTQLCRHRFAVNVRILTNKSALSGDNLELLGRLPVDYSVDLWSEQAERALLERCYAVFIPVNGQKHSVTKSLNRAVTALTAGTQVLSAGYPLYARLADFVYRDPEQLLTDLEHGTPKLRSETLPSFNALISRVADGRSEARRLVDTLSTMAISDNRRVSYAEPVLTAVVHGQSSNFRVHQFARDYGALSVGGPFCQLDCDFDLRFRLEANAVDLTILVSRNALVRPTKHDGILTRTRLSGQDYDVVTVATDPVSFDVEHAVATAGNSIFERTAGYAILMHRAVTLMACMYPGITACYYSEHVESAWMCETVDLFDIRNSNSQASNNEQATILNHQNCKF